MKIVEDDLVQVNRLIERFDLDGAHARLQTLIAENPESPEVLRTCGILEHLRGNHERAIEFLDRALKVNANDAISFVCAGQAYKALGALPLAEANLRRALQLDPNRHDAHLNLALTLWSMGEHVRAGTYFRNVGLLGRKSAHAEFYLGLLALEQGDLVSAGRHFDTCLEIDPDYLEAHVQKAQMQFDAGRTVDAAKQIDLSLVHQGATPQHYLSAAKFNLEIGDEAKALRRLQEALTAQRIATDAPVQFDAFHGRLADILSWGARADVPMTRVAREQRLKLREPSMLGAVLDPSSYPVPLTPDIYVVSVRECDVYPDGYVPISSDGAAFFFRVLSDGLRQPYSNSNILHVCDDGRVLLKKPCNRERLDGAALYIGDEPDYLSWLFQCVSRLWAYSQIPGMQEMPLLVYAEQGSWRDVMLSLLGVLPARRVSIPPDGRLTCEMLHIATQINPPKLVAPFALEYLRRQVRLAIQTAEPSIRRVFIARDSRESRGLANWRELAPAVESAGFTIVDPTSMTLARLIGMIMGAEVIMGVAGDAMANVFAAPARCRIGLIVARESNPQKYAATSMTLGQEFTFLAAEVDYSSSEVLEDCDLHLDSRLLASYLSTLQ